MPNLTDAQWRAALRRIKAGGNGATHDEIADACCKAMKRFNRNAPLGSYEPVSAPSTRAGPAHYSPRTSTEAASSSPDWDATPVSTAPPPAANPFGDLFTNGPFD